MSRLPRVCLVEDDPIMGESLHDRFGFEGFEVRWLKRADAVLAELRNHPADLLVCDIRLPDRSGIELFGHEKGAFTHAVAARRGLFELASGGVSLIMTFSSL